jgi:predicted dehydrogenase
MSDEIPNPDLPRLNRERAANRGMRRNMAGFRAPKIDTVRVGVIGLKRGAGHIKALLQVGNVEIRAVCDKDPAVIQRVLGWCEATGHTPEVYSDGTDAWKALCERSDLDLVYVCSPFPLHARMSIHAMQQGKHVASEVPAAGNMEECWDLVETAETTGKHLMMLENYSYMDFQLVMLQMAFRGFYGDIVHAEGAYNTSKEAKCFRKNTYSDMWWLREYARRRGNIYPTHGLGPICSALDINRGDRLDFLTSMESGDFTFGKRARELAATDPFYEDFADLSYRGNMSVTLLRTVRGRTMMIQHDPYSPSPHNLIHGIYGTGGAALFDPPPPRFSQGDSKWYKEGSEEYERLSREYRPRIHGKVGDYAKHHGHGGSDLRMNWHIIDCLRNGLPMPLDVYDAAAWSSIVPLTQWSVLNRSNAIDVPDFTAGCWETNPRNMDINLENGGGDTEILPPAEAVVEDKDHLERQWQADHAARQGG